MGRPALVPPHLTKRPFSLAEAQAAGLSRDHLRGSSWRRVGPGTFAWVGLAIDPWHEIAAAARRLPPGSAFSGFTSAWLHGLDVQPCQPIEATTLPAGGVSARSGIRLRRARVQPCDVVIRGGFPALSIVRTLADIAQHHPLVEAVVAADLALHARIVTIADVAGWVESHRGQKGIARFSRVAELADGLAESPMETRLRLVLVLAGLPRPQAQVTLQDDLGRIVGRADLYYSESQLAIEFDGAVHRTSLVEDLRRQNRMLAAGYRLLRFSGADVLGAPAGVVGQVRAALDAAAISPVRRRMGRKLAR